MHADAIQMRIENTAVPALKARGKTRLLTRSQLDGRLRSYLTASSFPRGGVCGQQRKCALKSRECPLRVSQKSSLEESVECPCAPAARHAAGSSRLAPQSIQPPHAVAMSSVSAQSRFDFSKMSSVIFLALGNAASKASRVIIVPSLFRRYPSPSLTHNWNLGGPMFSLASSRASRRFRSESFIGADRVVVLRASEGGARFRWPRLFSRSSRPT
jgi:hypothetical protein